MSLTVGALSSSKNMGLDEKRENSDKNGILMGGDEKREECAGEEGKDQRLKRQMSEASLCATDLEEENDDAKALDLGPRVSLKDQIEKDKDDDSLRRWKDQLLVSVDLNSVGEILEPEVTMLSLSILSPGRPDLVLPLSVTRQIPKTGVKVDRTKEMLGTFSPQFEHYTYETPEEVTPSGLFARGSYSARTKFVDDDGKCYLEINYTFDIRREWPSTIS